jgi:hypothetical protein
LLRSSSNRVPIRYYSSNIGSQKLISPWIKYTIFSSVVISFIVYKRERFLKYFKEWIFKMEPLDSGILYASIDTVKRLSDDPKMKKFLIHQIIPQGQIEDFEIILQDKNIRRETLKQALYKRILNVRHRILVQADLNYYIKSNTSEIMGPYTVTVVNLYDVYRTNYGFVTIRPPHRYLATWLILPSRKVLNVAYHTSNFSQFYAQEGDKAIPFLSRYEIDGVVQEQEGESARNNLDQKDWVYYD